MGVPRGPGEIAKTMQLKGMNTRQILEILNNENPELVNNVRKENADAAKLVDKYTAAVSKASNGNARLNSDPTLNKLTKLEQYCQNAIKLVAETKATSTLGTQLQSDLAQVPQSLSFSLNRDKMKKEVAELITTINTTITDIMTKLQAGSMTKEEIKRGLDSHKEISKKVQVMHEAIDKQFITEQDAVNKYSTLVQRTGSIIATTPALTSGPTAAPTAPKLDD